MNRKNIDEGKLRQLLSRYQSPEVTKQDIVATLRNYAGLTCKLEHFVFNDGNKMDLCNLQGTIPVTYKGSVYHIPVCIWLMDTHPNNAPMCYVKPTPDMHIKVSMYVDHNGKIYLPYLHDWVPNSSDLLGVIQVMTIMFGEQPPVYAKPKPRPESVANNAPYPTQSYMPQPSGASGATPGPGYPPYPSPASAYPTQSQGYPPYPSYPASSTAGGGFPPYPAFNSAGPGYPPYGNTPAVAAGTGPGAYPPYPPYPTGNAQAAAGAGGTITEEHIRASLLSAVEDKLRRRLREQLSQSQAELDTLGRIQLELMQGKTKLESIIETLEKEQVELDKNITVLQDKEEELEKSIARLSEQQPIDVDEAVTTTAPLYKQLLNAYAEEAAIEDAVYYMGEALRRGVIDLDVFLKQVRTLTRKQFMLRALMHKCRQKAGLVG